MTPLTISNFDSLEHWNHYQFLVRQIENEKALLAELMESREKYILRLHAYNGSYKGMAEIAECMRHANKRILQTKDLLKKLTNKYEIILRCFVK